MLEWNEEGDWEVALFNGWELYVGLIADPGEVTKPFGVFVYPEGAQWDKGLQPAVISTRSKSLALAKKLAYDRTKNFPCPDNLKEPR